ncbi:MAG: integrase [Deltaproteobacteria bacterium]|nr:MAG: integrase [Deltaproteobacteria bacterium]
MSDTDFAQYITGFLSRYLPGQRNLSKNTISSYRDAFKLFLLFCESEEKLKIKTITIADITPKLLVRYLAWLERVRRCGIATRNQRLAAFKSFFHYVVGVDPKHLLLYQQVLGLPMKKNHRPMMSFFSPEGLHQLLRQPNTATKNGRRDHALLVLIYDTAARVQEIIDLAVRDIRLMQPATVVLHGKGRKTRIVPISAKTASILEMYLEERGYIGGEVFLDLPIFTNSRNCKLTRAGVAHILARHVKSMSTKDSHFVPKSVSPHTLRHYGERYKMVREGRKPAVPGSTPSILSPFHH